MKKIAVAILAGSLFSTGALAASYKVTITNLTRAQSFTPILVASHKPDIKLFELGEPASAELAALAEGGATQPLATSLEASGRVFGINTTTAEEGLLDPGETVVVYVAAPRYKRARISMAAMLLPTNDGFITLNSVRAPFAHETVTYYAPVHDAGSEPNDESCVNIPGPLCGGQPDSPPHAEDEGYVHIHAGIHGGAGSDLDAATYDWRNPAAKITIERTRY